MSRQDKTFNIKKAVTRLFRVSESRLSKTDLEFLSQASDLAEEMAADAAKVARGLAFLIQNDQAAPGSQAAGNFDDEAPLLLHHFSNQFDVISALVILSQEAEYQLQKQNAQAAIEGEQPHDRPNLQ